MKLHRLIKENSDVNKVDLKLLNYLHKNSISTNPETIYNILHNELHIEDNDLIGNVIKLYKNNIIGDDEIYDESFGWSIPSEKDYSDERRALSKIYNLNTEFFIYRGNVYDLKIYKNIEDGQIYEVGTFEDLFFSIKSKGFDDNFNNFRKTFLENYIKLNEEILDYNIQEMVKEEIDESTLEEMMSALPKKNFINYEEDKEVILELNDELKKEQKNMKSLLRKIESLESEKAVIEQQIEDGDEDYNRFSKHLNKIETKLNELNQDYHNLLKYIYDLESDISDLEENVPSEQEIIDMYFKYSYEGFWEDFTYNPFHYLNESNMTLIEAYEDDYITFDYEGLINDTIKNNLRIGDIKVVDVDNQTYFITHNFNVLF